MTTTVERTRAGLQYVLPRAERISNRELAARLVSMPLRPRARQRSLHGTALFG